jgi:hypothetical protein
MKVTAQLTQASTATDFFGAAYPLEYGLRKTSTEETVEDRLLSGVVENIGAGDGI